MTNDDAAERQFREAIEAFRRFSDELPEDLRNLPIKELQRLWNDPEQCARLEPAVRRLAQAVAPAVREFAEVFAGMARGVQAAAKLFQQIREKVLALREGVVRAEEWGRRAPQLASQYCQPYQRQIAQLCERNLKPLTRSEEWSFMVMAAALSLPDERGLGRRPPLEYVALANGRLDLAVAVLVKERPDLLRLSKPMETLPREWEDLPGDVVVALREKVLPSLEKRLQEVTIPEAQRVLENWLSNQYLVASIRNSINRQRGRVRKQAALEAGPLREPGDTEAKVDETSVTDVLAMEHAVEEYLQQSDRPELDRQILDALKEGTSMAELGRRIDVPERTLRSRKERLFAFCRCRLGLPE